MLIYSPLMAFSPQLMRSQFPFLQKKDPAIYLDSAATSQKPEIVMSELRRMMEEESANPNRGVYPLAEKSTLSLMHARKTIAAFIGAVSAEIVFTKNATEGVNLVARSLGETLRAGDRIALSIMEHHSNIVPWMQLSERREIGLDWIRIDENGLPDTEELRRILALGKTKLVALSGMSNVLGSVPDLPRVASIAHEAGALLLVDAAQLIAHQPVDVKEIDCDFLVFSGHKLYGPTGIGVLYGKRKHLESLPPFLGGGDMIESVTQDGFSPAELPRKFEAGTMPLMEAAGLATAIKWMNDIGKDAIFAHEDKLISHAISALSSVKNLTILGTKNPQKRKGCISFAIAGVHPHDLAEVLGREGICIRGGHHCAQPLHVFLKLQASARLSVAAYNTTEEIDRCVSAIEKAQKILTK